MKKLRTFAVSMIIVAIGLLIYCAGFYIKTPLYNFFIKKYRTGLSDV